MQPLRNGDGKEFVSHAPGYWPGVAPELWNDWKWQLKNRVTSLAQLEQHIELSEEERSIVDVAVASC
jgi:lysine 2,3-aminomutase